MKTLEFAVDALKKREFSILKSSLKGWAPPSLSQRALGAFRKYQVVSRTHLVRKKEAKQEVSIAI